MSEQNDMYKTTIIIWSSIRTNGLSLEKIGFEADQGAMRATTFECTPMTLEQARLDEDWDGLGNEEFFVISEDEDEDEDEDE